MIHVHILPKFADPEQLADGSVVIIDVLRASTTIIHALHAGAKAVVPCREIDEALTIAKRYRREEIILGGERGGLPIDGFDLGNSPEEYTPELVRGKTIIFTTTNGTRALLHARIAKQIILGAFVNASAVVQKLLMQEQASVHLLCAGTAGQVGEDDVLFAGMLAENLQHQGGKSQKLTDQAIAARDLWRHTFNIDRALEADRPEPEDLAKTLERSIGGKKLVALGLKRDVLAAAQIDRFAIVPQFNPETSCIEVAK